MTTLSVPLTKELETRLEELVKNGVGENKASVMRKALKRLAEEEAVERVLRAQREPTLYGDLDKLAEAIDD